jgi:hypothetical protein
MYIYIGINYPKVDPHIYKFVDQLGGREMLEGADVVVMGSAVPWCVCMCVCVCVLPWYEAPTLQLEKEALQWLYVGDMLGR